MLDQIKGLHHVTSLASSAAENNAFFTQALGLRRVKKTVNFDKPNVYHLYYGDEAGSPGTVMTYFPYPQAARGKAGTGEVGRTSFSIPTGSLNAWIERFSALDVEGLAQDTRFGDNRLLFDGPDGEGFALVEADGNDALAWTGQGIPLDMAIRGFHSAEMRLADGGVSAELLRFMGYEQIEKQNDITRFRVPGDMASVIDIQALPDVEPGKQGAGSVHHIAFAVENRARQLEVREALMDTGYQVTNVIDRDYFWAIYFRSPDGVLFEVATNEPGFATDEDTAHLGQALQLPSQHAHLRDRLERQLEPIA